MECIPILQRACSGNIAFTLYLLCAEYYWHCISGEFWGFIFYRGAVLLVLVVWKLLLSLPTYQESAYANTAFCICYGSIILVMHSIIAERQIHDIELAHTPSFLFHAGLWSQGHAMLYISFCFHLGLLFADSFRLGGVFTFLYTILPFFIFYPSQASLLNSFTVLTLPFFYFLCAVSAHDSDIKLRQRFLKLTELGHSLRRQDTLIHSILPPDISLALKNGDSQNLATYHSNVTVLFCSIVDFSSQSSSSHADDIVKLLIRIVAMFDRIVGHMGVYKVENIADTYLCCDEVDLTTSPSKDRIVRIARTAIAMREAAEYFQWKWSDGSPVRLKIGIHSGRNRYVAVVLRLGGWVEYVLRAGERLTKLHAMCVCVPLLFRPCEWRCHWNEVI